MQIPLAFASKPGIVGARRETSSKVCCTSRANYISRNKLHNEQLFREKYAYLRIKFTLREIRIYTHFATFDIGIEAGIIVRTRWIRASVEYNFLSLSRVILFRPDQFQVEFNFDLFNLCAFKKAIRHFFDCDPLDPRSVVIELRSITNTRRATRHFVGGRNARRTKTHTLHAAVHRAD